ncbi:conserved protein of unknown function; Putative Peptidase C48, SUMO [Bradyrhizobium sp. ORS 285]|uniref:Ulp1 family isopeptidase n=1 Tax=Bradyrhizobium sp. ORS 285 TaxID=115808 RepID=UPI000B56105B|nr:Ulp1 family isopeptidase [Bradyrhizobium sp. ORS 285]SMX56439.1 conserved protein of unknown function; Putative Peptidase C48, SUMO [Bradyrhizobium sp. ORS 285]
MEPGYSDPNYWMRWYAEQQELLRARQEADLEPVDQAGFDQQLSELQLRSSEESSPEASSPDTPVVRSDGNIQRASNGGLVLVPQGQDLRDSLFNGAHYSVDVQRAHPGSGAGGLGLLSSGSLRYEAPLEAQSTVRTKEYSKPRGFFSRMKSGLGKVLGGRRSEKSSGDPEYVVLHSELRIDCAKRHRPSDADQELIEGFKTALVTANRNPETIKNYTLALEQFSEFLQSKSLVLKDVLDSPDLLAANKDEFMQGASAHSRGRRSLNAALNALNSSLAGESPAAPSRGSSDLIEDFRTALRAANFHPRTVSDYGVALRQFSELLQSKGLTLKDVLGDPDLLTASKDEFMKGASAHSTGRKSLGGALRVLQDFQAGKTIEAHSRVYTHGHPMHPSDELLISQFEKAVREYKIEPDGTRGRGTGTVPSETILKSVRALTAFARWLLAHNKDPLARLYTEPTSLADDVDEYLLEGGGGDRGRLSVALSHLRRLSSDGQLAAIGAGPRLMGRQTFAPHPEDAVAIDRGMTNALSMGEERSAAGAQASLLRGFSDWLQREGRPTIVDRIDGTVDQQASLRADHVAYRKTGKHVPGFDQIRAFLGLGPGFRPYHEDAGLIEGLANEELSKPNPPSRQKRAAIRDTTSAQREFSDWLRTTGRTSIASRINGNDEQRCSLDRDYEAFKEVRGKAPVALKKLRQYAQVVDANRALGLDLPQQRGEPDASSAWRRTLPQPPSEAEWTRSQPDRFGQAGLQTSADSSSTSTWLQDLQLPAFFDFPTPEGAPAHSSEIYQGLSSFADLPSTPQAVRDDAQSAYFNVFPEDAPVPSSEIYQGLSSFADLPSTPQAVRDDAQSAYFNVFPEDAPVPSSEIYQGLSSFTDLPYTPQAVRDDAQSSYFNALPEGAPVRSSEIYQGLSSFTDLPSTPQDMRDDAQSRPALSPAGAPPFFIGPSGVLQELEDIGHLVGEDWRHGSQPVPDYLIDVLDNKMLLPSSRMAPQPVAINGETYSVTMGPRGRRDSQFVHHPRHLAAWDAQAGTSGTAASSGDRSGRVLGSMQWLGDEHIQRDYELLSEELQQSNPDLAARTRFVDPLMAFQLAHSTGADALRAFHIIVSDRNENDTADFLFLPVNNASISGLSARGTHWSLLLVDRRNRDRPVAYHYDSAQQYGNAGPAARLAAAVGANPQHAPIAQQSNSYDCGVFVVDGTRELARRLAGGRQVDLNLSNLIVDRQALQNRLKS